MKASKEDMKILEQVKTVDVLGVPYAIIDGDRSKDAALDKADGYCDHTIKTCVIDTLIKTSDSVADLETYRKQVIRHELVHAFLFEWIAYQFPKMLQAFDEADAL